MQGVVDLRSDTVTRPTSAMLRAMVTAEVGDDVHGDDPTVVRLERRAAEILGKEAALFVPSGTMGNVIAMCVHARPGDEVLLDADSHSMFYEVGAPASIAGLLTRQYRSIRGIPDVGEIEAAIMPGGLHEPGTTLVGLENTHNRHGGAVIPVDVMRQVYALTQSHGIKVHLDGARLFNAAVATGTPAADYAAQADSVCFCLSKGLGCPVGSMLCGSANFVERSRRVRKRLGGGMRQVGVLAACGLVALDTMIDRLAEDHALARRLANGLTGLPGIKLDSTGVQTNMVYFQTERPAEEMEARLAVHGVLCLPMDPHRVRMVTHFDVDGDDIDRAIAAMRAVTTP